MQTNKTITKNLRCVLLRNGVEIWAEEERMAGLIQTIQNIKESKFVSYDGEIFNTADITGIFTPATMDDYTRIKNKQWKCKRGTWHNYREPCDCPEPQWERDERSRTVAEEIKAQRLTNNE